MSGLLVENQYKNVQISTDVTPLSFSHKNEYDFILNNVQVPLGKGDGTFSVWHRGDNDSRIYDIGLYHSLYADPTVMARRRVHNSNTLKVTEYVFDSSPTEDVGYGLQLFNEEGKEVFNSNRPVLSIIDSVSFNVYDLAWVGKNSWVSGGEIFVDRTYWEKTYSGYTKLGLFFKNLPAGITKTKDFYQIWAYFYHFRTSGNKIEIALRPEYFFASRSSAVIDLDKSLRFEFFVVDLSHIP